MDPPAIRAYISSTRVETHTTEEDYITRSESHLIYVFIVCDRWGRASSFFFIETSRVRSAVAPPDVHQRRDRIPRRVDVGSEHARDR